MGARLPISFRDLQRRRRIGGPALALSLALTGLSSHAEPLADVVVTATRVPERSFELPASIDRVEGRELRDGQLSVNLSETLGRIPGISVQNRQNYAQDLQISVRGFGARASFGVRGVRLYADGIPGTMPDGQGQFSHFDLGAADRVEILRGPFSALYGNSSGGVIAIFTEDGLPGHAVGATAAAGSFGTQRYSLKGSGDTGTFNYVADVAHFETDGFRDHSRAERNTANAKARFTLGAQTTLTLVGNAIETPAIEDPLGLTRIQYTADPSQAGANAVLYNTRKSLGQEQVGATLTTALTGADVLTAMLYDGRRRTTQYQAILSSVEAKPTHPGGVVDLGRDFRGADVHVTDDRSPGGTSLKFTGGVSIDSLEEARRGYLNFIGSQLGVEGALRLDVGNRVTSADEYLQLEWDPDARWRTLAGVRHSEIEIVSRDHRSVNAAPSDIVYSAVSPVAGVTFRATPALNAYASYGRGFETPTLNDLAYRSTDGSVTGLNLGLVPARSDNFEIGVKSVGERYRVDAAAFFIRTRHELAVLANSGGRSVYGNIDETERRGGELGLTSTWNHGLSGRLAYTYIRAVTASPYRSCAGLPCQAITVPEGNRLPAVPENSLYAALTWTAPDESFTATGETIGRSKIYVDDRNSDAAAGYWATNVHASIHQSVGHWVLTESARIDNLFDRRFASTVIVNESNGRYFEPSPGRTLFVLFRAAHR